MTKKTKENPFLKALKEKSESTETETSSGSSEACGSGSLSDLQDQTRISLPDAGEEWLTSLDYPSIPDLSALTSDAIKKMEAKMLANSQYGILSGPTFASQAAQKNLQAAGFAIPNANYGSTYSSPLDDMAREIQNIKDWTKKVNERLAILEPKKELLDKFEALREAYEHYKILEAMVMSELDNGPPK